MSSSDYADHRGEGNTNPPSRNTSMRRVCMTLNNYTEVEYADLIDLMISRKYKYIIAKEVGENGTPHLQCYIEFGKALKFRTVKNLQPRAHWEKARGNREDNLKYCTKDDNYNTNFVIRVDQAELFRKRLYNNVVWKDWQQQIIDECAGDETIEHMRKITWIVDRPGCAGKSFLARYLYIEYGTIIASGKKADVFNQIKEWIADKEKEMFRIVVLDIPRKNFEYVNYGAIEEIKNGLIHSGKYEGGTCLFWPPHVIVFANEEPDYNALSADRWDVRFI